MSTFGTALVVAAGGGGDGCAGTGSSGTNDSETLGGNAEVVGGQGGNAGDDGRGGQPGTSVGGGTGGEHGTSGSSAKAGEHGVAGTGGAGGGSEVVGPASSGSGGGGGGGLYGGGGGGGGAAANGVFAYAGSGGGGGGGSSLVPAGGSSALDSSASPRVVVSYNLIAFTSGAPPAGAVGQPYGYAYSAVGDAGITYAIAGGTLPPGLTLSPSGTLLGTPTTAGSYSYTVTATGASAIQSRSDTITIAKAPTTPTESPKTTFHLVGAPHASSSGLSFSLACVSATRTVCRFRAQLSTLEHVLGSKVVGISARRTKRRSARVTVGEANFVLASGVTRRFSVSLNSTGSNLLKRFRTLPVTLTVTLVSPGPPTVTKRTAKIKEPRKRNHHR